MIIKIFNSNLRTYQWDNFFFEKINGIINIVAADGLFKILKIVVHTSKFAKKHHKITNLTSSVVNYRRF